MVVEGGGCIETPGTCAFNIHSIYLAVYVFSYIFEIQLIVLILIFDRRCSPLGFDTWFHIQNNGVGLYLII